MIHTTMVVSLVLSGVNWLVVLASVIVENMAAIRLALDRQFSQPHGEAADLAYRGLQPDKVIDATGSLPTALRRAGPAASAAAMSPACLLVALAAGVPDKL